MELMDVENPEEDFASSKNVSEPSSIEDRVLESENDELNSDDDEKEDKANEEEVRQLESLLSSNPYDYESHVALISKLQSMSELEKLREARENMSSKYPLSPELWLGWLRDEMKLAVTAEERLSVSKLCERAVKDYVSVEIWLEYLQFSIGSMGDNVGMIRSLFERALTSVGLHVTKGAIIWEAFREFENVLVSMTTNDEEKQQQIDRVGNLFRRQLACPLLEMEKTLDEYQAWRADCGKDYIIDDKIIMASYERACVDLNSRLPFEEKILSQENTTELYDFYQAYLLYEKRHGDPGRISVLYERALTDLSLESRLWIDYLSYIDSTIKIESVLAPIYERASRNVPWCFKIWQKWMRSLEQWDKPLLDIQSLLESALVAGFSTADDYRTIWMTYFEYLRRKMDNCDGEEKEKQLEILREAFNRACEHLAKMFGLEGDPQCVVLQFWARIEAIHANNMEKTRSLWADILSQDHSSSAASWLEYVSIERCYGDTKHLRKLFSKALTAVKDWPESIANAWIDFERDEGTLEQMQMCEAKVQERLAKVQEQRQKVQDYCQKEKPQAQRKVTILQKRKADNEGKWEKLELTSSKQAKIMKKTISQTEGKATTMEVSSELRETADQIVDDRITVFVSNLDYTATEEEIREALKPAGPITLFKMVKDYKGRSKGFCYVQLTSSAAVNQALKLDRTPINNRPMFVSRCDPDKTTRGTSFKYPCILEKNKLFVKGLPLTKTKKDIENLFKEHGTLREVRLVTYRNGHSKGLAYVEFEDECSASKALLATDGMTLDDKVISVAISKPPERKKGLEDQQIKSLGGSSVSRTHFGLPKTMLSMIPRSVKSTVKNSSSQATQMKPMNNQDFRDMLINKKVI